METIFKVNGKPFFPIGGQTRNSSAYSPQETEAFWKALDFLGGNAAEIPVYWDMIEPEEGKFDFTIIDDLIKSAHERNKRLIILWFATWKNGMMKYAPLWVKENTERFKRVIAHDGASLFVLSTHCSENLRADSRAFRAVMQHIHEVDDRERTVIAMQVENEPGTIGKSYRDHGPEAEKEYLAAVPPFLIEQIRKKGSGPEYDIWKQNGSKLTGNWPEVFGRESSEFLSAYSLAKFVDKVAEEGKKAHDIPMYVNVWLDRQDWELPGISYPSGAPEEKVLDIWKWTAKNIDIIAPDIYKYHPNSYRRYCEVYNREDNALFIPESSCAELPESAPNASNMFYAIGKYDAIGYFAFGLEHILLEDGTVNPASKAFVGSVRALTSALPLIMKYRGTGKMIPIVQEEYMHEQQLLDMEEYDGLVMFDTFYYVDYHHRSFQSDPQAEKEKGRGLIIQTAKNEFYVLGAGFILLLREKHSDIDYSEIKRNDIIYNNRIEEGHFDDDGNFHCDRIRNGDESDGIWVFPDNGVIRVVMGK